MSHSQLSRSVFAVVLIAAAANLGCDRQHSRLPTEPTQPAAPAAPVALAVLSVSPNPGLSGGLVRISGTGFLYGATVTLDGLRAVVTRQTSTDISALIPERPVGSVDVVVTNPGGQRGTLTAGFTYAAVTITASATVAAPGAQLSVSWVAPPGRPVWDWVGLFKVGDVSLGGNIGTRTQRGQAPHVHGFEPVEGCAEHDHLWFVYTGGASTGTVTLAAPTEPGQYEFRYMIDDNFTEAGRTATVTVTADYLVESWVSVDPSDARSWKVTSSDPMRMASPSASWTGAVTRSLPRKVPFLLPKSSSTVPPADTTNRAWRREIVEASSLTSTSGSRPTTFSPAERGKRRLPHSSQHDTRVAAVLGAPGTLVASPQKA